MTSAATRQGELKGLRPAAVIELEEAIWELKEAKDEQKKLKERVDECAEAVASKLRKADTVAHGFSRGGEQVTATLEDKEVVKLSVAKPKGKKKSGTEGRQDAKGPLGFGRV